MLSILVISLQEYLEAFFIIIIFLGISKKLSLKKEKEIIAASIIGIFIALIIPLISFSLTNSIRSMLNEHNIDIVEGILMIFSGFFITYTTYSLHKVFSDHKSKTISHTHDQIHMKNDFPLFFTIAFLILKEGLEISIFTSSSSLLSSYIENVVSLFLGLILSTIIGFFIFLIFKKFPIHIFLKIVKIIIFFIGLHYILIGFSKFEIQNINITKTIFIGIYLTYNVFLIRNNLKYKKLLQ